MNHKPKKSRRKPQVIRVWTYPQAKSALPYITSVMHSLREHWLDAQRQEVHIKQLARQPGRLDRAALVANETAQDESQRAKNRFNEAYEELQNIEVFCIDPNQGVGVIPFVHDEKLAWLIYDMFAPDDLHHWRYHDDPLEMRRPIAEALAGPPAQSA
jgi:hypothetical protein